MWRTMHRVAEPRTYTKSQKRRAVRAVELGATCVDAAGLIGASGQTVAGWCRKAGVAVPRRGRYRGVDPEVKADAVRRVRGGERPSRVAAEIGVSHAAVHNWVRDARPAEPADEQLPAVSPPARSNLVELVQRGLPIRKVAAMHGVDVDELTGWVRAA